MLVVPSSMQMQAAKVIGGPALADRAGEGLEDGAARPRHAAAETPGPRSTCRSRLAGFDPVRNIVTTDKTLLSHNLIDFELTHVDVQIADL